MIYLDNNATTASLPEVVKAVTETLENIWGNPSSAHQYGRRAREALEIARAETATAFGVSDTSRIFFTSTGTESINLAFACLLTPDIHQILVPATEHIAVLRAAERWADGRKVSVISVDANGLLDLDQLLSEATASSSLMSIGFANNETGVIANITAVSEICRDAHALLHLDAIQAAGKVPLDIETLACDAASLSAHKFHGPPGCGVLYLKRPPDGEFARRVLSPGHQEYGLRAGTENLPSIVGCGVAASLIKSYLPTFIQVKSLRDRFETAMIKNIPGSQVHGISVCRLPNTTNLFCPCRSAADLVAIMSHFGLAASAGAACSNGRTASHVIKAMGFSDERANSSLRFSLCGHTTEDEITEATGIVTKAYLNTLPSF